MSVRIEDLAKTELRSVTAQRIGDIIAGKRGITAELICGWVASLG